MGMAENILGRQLLQINRGNILQDLILLLLNVKVKQQGEKKVQEEIQC